MGSHLFVVAYQFGDILNGLLKLLKDAVAYAFSGILTIIYEVLRNGFVALTEMVTAPIKMDLEEFRGVLPFASAAYKWILWFGIGIAVLILITQLFIGIFNRDGKEHPVKLLFTTALTLIFMFLAPTVFDAGINFARVPYDGLEKVIKNYEPNQEYIDFVHATVGSHSPQYWISENADRIDTIVEIFKEPLGLEAVTPYHENITLPECYAIINKLGEILNSTSDTEIMLGIYFGLLDPLNPLTGFDKLKALQQCDSDLKTMDLFVSALSQLALTPEGEELYDFKLSGDQISFLAEEMSIQSVSSFGNGKSALDQAADDEPEKGNIGFIILSLILSILFMFFIGWNYIKLVLECVERYLLLGVLYFTAPIPIAAGVSDSTRQVFKSWIRMCVSQVLVLFFSMWFLHGASTVIGHAFWRIQQNPNLMVFYLAIIVAYLKVGQHIDEYMGILGMSAAKTGRGMLEDTTTAFMVIRQGIHGARHNASERHGSGSGSVDSAVAGVFGGTKPPTGSTGAGDFSARKVNASVQRQLGMTDSVENAQVSKGRISGVAIAPDGTRSEFIARPATAEEISGEKPIYKNEAIKSGAGGEKYVMTNVLNKDQLAANKMNLDGFNLDGVDARGMNLTNAVIKNSNLGGMDASESNLSGAVIENSSVDGFNASGANMGGITMINTSGAMDLSDATISNNSMISGDLSGSRVSRLTIKDSTLNGVDLSAAQGRGMTVENSHLQNVRIAGKDTKLEGVSITHSTMNDSVIGAGATISGKDGEALMNDVRGSGNNFSGVQMNNTAYKDVLLHDTKADGASFVNSKFENFEMTGEKSSAKNANFAGSEFGGNKGSDFSGTNLQGASFEQGSLNNTHMNGSNLRGASFKDATADSNTTMRNADLADTDLRFASVGRDGIEITGSRNYDESIRPKNGYATTASDNTQIYTIASASGGAPSPEPIDPPSPGGTSMPEPTDTPAPGDIHLPRPTDTLVPSDSPMLEPTDTLAPSDIPLPEPTHTLVPDDSPMPEPTDTPTPGDIPMPEPTDMPAPGDATMSKPTDTHVPGGTPMPEPTDTHVPGGTPMPEPTDKPVTGDATMPEPTDTHVPGDTPLPGPFDTPVLDGTPLPGSTDVPVPSDTPMPEPTDTPAPGDTPLPGPFDTPILDGTPLPGSTDVPVLGDTPLPRPTVPHIPDNAPASGANPVDAHTLTPGADVKPPIFEGVSGQGAAPSSQGNPSVDTNSIPHPPSLAHASNPAQEPHGTDSGISGNPQSVNAPRFVQGDRGSQMRSGGNMHKRAKKNPRVKSTKRRS